MPLIFLYFLNMKIIIIALSGIGDALMFTPALKLLRAQLPDAQIDVLVMFKGARDIFINNPNINNVYRFDFLQKGSVKSLKYILSLRGNYDTSINVYPSNRKEYNIISFLIGAKNRAAVKYLRRDFSNLGFLNGMIILANMIELGQVRYGLIVAGETAEGLVQSTIEHLLTDATLTRKSIKPVFASLTIGSGAVALVMGDRKLKDTGHRLVAGACRANTRHNDLCRGGQNAEQGTLMSTDSELLLTEGVDTARMCWQSFLQESGWKKDSIDQFFCHQVGRAHAQQLFSTLELDSARNFETLPVLGNVGSVSAPITMAMGIEKRKLKPGQRGAILGIGSGINSLMLGIDW